MIDYLEPSYKRVVVCGPQFSIWSVGEPMNDTLNIEPTPQAVDEVLELANFIRWWNSGNSGFSVITSWSKLIEALAMDKTRWVAYCDAVNACRKKGVAIRRPLAKFLSDVIRDSAENALAAQAATWAATIAIASPTLYVDDPFTSPLEWALFCLRTLEPPLITSPQGVTQLSQARLQPILRRALIAYADVAAQSGWIVSARA